MRSVLEFWLSLSRLNRIAVDLLLFWLAAGSVLGLGALGNGALRGFVKPFLALTVLAGVMGAMVAGVEGIRLVHGQFQHPGDAFDERRLARRNLRVAVLLAVANAFPAFVLGLAWQGGFRFFD